MNQFRVMIACCLYFSSLLRTSNRIKAVIAYAKKPLMLPRYLAIMSMIPRNTKFGGRCCPVTKAEIAAGPQDKKKCGGVTHPHCNFLLITALSSSGLRTRPLLRNRLLDEFSVIYFSHVYRFSCRGGDCPQAVEGN